MSSQKSSKRRGKGFPRRLTFATWWIAGFFAAGYFPITIAKNYVLPPPPPPPVVRPPVGAAATSQPTASQPTTASQPAPSTSSGQATQPATTAVPLDPAELDAALKTATTISIALMAAGIAPIGSRSKSVKAALIRGLLLGIVGGISMSSAIAYKSVEASSANYRYAFAVPLFCAAVAALFAHLAAKRREHADEQWR